MATYPDLDDDDRPIVFSYSRAEALLDGVLVDVSPTAREAGFRYPVAITHAVWALIESIPPNLRHVENVSGRLWDVLQMALFAARCRPTASELHYSLTLHRVVESRPISSLILKMVCGPGDNAEPVITIMLPNED